MSKLTICLLCGGQSTEHEVSLLSAKNVLAAISREHYDVLVVGIEKDGTWRYFADEKFIVNADDPRMVAIAQGGEVVFACKADGKSVLARRNGGRPMPFDVIFPVLHGANGEDGAVQGLAQLLDCPCVGCGMLASAICMDKDVAKRLLEYHGIKTAPWKVAMKGSTVDCEAIVNEFGLPLFVKPANAGSSVGVVKVRTMDDFLPALKEAWKFDKKVLIEKAMVGREIECAVLGNGTKTFCAVPGEIVPNVEFYSYDAKYTMDDGAELKAPAELDDETRERIQSIAQDAYICLGCSGMARVDFFLLKDGSIVLNEINTIPGFTQISMYPRLMGLSGIGYSELVDKLVKLALEK